ncbi:MAG TPA: AmmeMemoRadiSam system protein B, partial [Fodinibius sp.]|nr:AmmeMemoRadiSam system protein B [Fodinibius sp.]
MGKTNIFSSGTNPIPEIRKDLEIIPIQENENSYLYFQDQRRYATPDLALRREAGPLLSLIDGRRSIHDLKQHVNGNATQKDLLEFIQFLDRNRLLESAYFDDFAEQTETEYEQSTVHKAITAGSSYPADPKALTDYLDEAFSNHKSKLTYKKPRALYAPHIDPRIALDRYVEAFAPIKDLKPKRVVMLATSHYSGWYPELYEVKPFILVNKDFELPLGNIRRDADAIAALSKRDEDYGIATHDRAHRMEH